VVHAAFPTCPLDTMGLLQRQPRGERQLRVSHSFTLARDSAAFTAGRKAFVAATLAEPLPANPKTATGALLVDGSAILWQSVFDAAGVEQ